MNRVLLPLGLDLIYETFLMLTSSEHETLIAHTNENAEKINTFLTFKLPHGVFIMLTN